MEEFNGRLIFINYRRSETSGTTGRMIDSLKTVIEEKYFFLDVDSIGDGEQFPVRIKQSIDECRIFIAVIGPQWLQNMNVQLESDPADWVRTEIATALKKKKDIIPVLVQGAVMPKQNELPKDLKGLENYNAAELSHTRWQYDIDKLTKALKKKDIPLKTETKAYLRKGFYISVTVVFVLLLIFILANNYFFKTPNKENKSKPNSTIAREAPPENNEEKMGATNKNRSPADLRKIDAGRALTKLQHLLPLAEGKWKMLIPENTGITYVITQNKYLLTVEYYYNGQRQKAVNGFINNEREVTFALNGNGSKADSYQLKLSDDGTRLTGAKTVNIKVGNNLASTPVTLEKQ